MRMTHLSFFITLCLGVYGSSSEILQRSKRNWIIDSFKIKESYKGPFPYTLGRIDIESNVTLVKIQGQGVDKEPKGLLQIDPHSGIITVHGEVDYEEFKVLMVKFIGQNKENLKLEIFLGIEIQIEDANDNPPRFQHESYEVSIAESTKQGTDVIAIQAIDLDGENVNQAFNFNIISVTPKSESIEFYIRKAVVTNIGIVSFKGCLDHETAERYTIIVEVKDEGEIQLSGSTTIIVNVEDGNNHFPEIIGHTAPGKVTEGVKDVLISRVHVRDNDSKGTAAWKVKYKIHEDTGNFRISTDPETNDGLLYLEKPLIYEETPLLNVTISVENEMSFYSCKVVNRKATGIWEISTFSGGYVGSGIGIGSATWTETLSQSRQQETVVVMVETEPLVFDMHVKEVTVIENTEAGQWLASFAAKSRDTKSLVKISYMKGHDPADWVIVDAETGKVTTSKALDRESVFVNQSIYNVTIYAVDSAIPPMTATATLIIHVFDENDNAPVLNVNTVDMCQSDGPSLTLLSAVDLDEDPYSGPFTFKLLGNVEGKWRLDPQQGYSVNLVKENTVYSGKFKLTLEVSDRQEKAAVHNLSVTVCQCSVERPNCRSPKATSVTVGREAQGISFFVLLLLAGIVLLAFHVSCKKRDLVYKSDINGEDSRQNLMCSNTEMPGTDCKVDFQSLFQERIQMQESQLEGQNVSIEVGQSVGMTAAKSLAHWEQAVIQKQQQQRILMHSSSDASSIMRTRQLEAQNGDDMHKYKWNVGFSSSMRSMRQLEGQSRSNMHKGYMTGSEYAAMSEVGTPRGILSRVLNRKLHKLQMGSELGDYAPRVYADEGDAEINYELDAISIADIPFDPDLELDEGFIKLASICMR